MTRRLLPAFGLVASCLVTAPALAQTAGQPPRAEQDRRQGRGAPADQLTVQEVERQFDRLELFEAQRALGLDAESFLPVAERLERLQSLRRRHQNQRRLILRDLRAAVAPGAAGVDEATLAARLAELSGLGVRQAQEMRRAQLALEALLTVRQRAMFRLFQERFERQKLDLLVRARQARGRGGLPAPGR
jgi:hypothetical protein